MIVCGHNILNLDDDSNKWRTVSNETQVFGQPNGVQTFKICIDEI